MQKIENLNIIETESIPTPLEIKSNLPISEDLSEHVFTSREVLQNILTGKDKRVFAVVGPCSIHNTQAALDYAKKLKVLSDTIRDEIFVVMRVYFEKPRTTVGWKGLINDPYLDDSFKLEDGLKIARQLMLEINQMGLPIGTEALDPISPQYLIDLVSWAAIGARTTESQTHRELASGLSCPVGFKNGTDGSVSVAVNAMQSAATSHSFLGINDAGTVSVLRTRGNKFGHLILRGGTSGPNHDSVSVEQARAEVEKSKLPENIVVDCSHANSHKNHNLQTMVLHDVIRQRCDGNLAIKGFMLESNLFEGNQKLKDKKDLVYGVSITDACLGWDSTEKILMESFEMLKNQKSN